MHLGPKGFQKKGGVKANEAGHAGEDATAIEAAHLLLALASPSDAAFSTPSPRQAAAKRRRSDVDSLSGKMWQSEWYREETHTQFLLESRDVELTSAKITLRSKKARAAAAVRWSGHVKDEEGAVFEKDAKTGALGPGMAAARCTTIGFSSCITTARRPCPSGAAAAASFRSSCAASVRPRAPRTSCAKASGTSPTPNRRKRLTTRV